MDPQAVQAGALGALLGFLARAVLVPSVGGDEADGPVRVQGILAGGHPLVDAVQPPSLLETADLVLRGEPTDGCGGKGAEHREPASAGAQHFPGGALQHTPHTNQRGQGWGPKAPAWIRCGKI